MRHHPFDPGIRGRLRLRVLALSAMFGLLPMLAAGCGTDLFGAGLDLKTLSAAPETPIAGEEITFTVTYTNRSKTAHQFLCRIGEDDHSVTLSAPPGAEDADIDFAWPGLAQGEHKISCGVLATKKLPDAFSLAETVAVGPPAEASATPPSGMSIGVPEILENERVWSGKLKVRVGFDNPSRTGGAIRCATAPSTLGPQIAQVTREREGTREFEFSYPENQSANYTVRCAVGPAILDDRAKSTESFTVGL